MKIKFLINKSINSYRSYGIHKNSPSNETNEIGVINPIFDINVCFISKCINNIVK